MKCLRRNTKVYYFANYVGKTELLDEDGNYTGESEIKYSDVKTVRGTLSAVTGSAETEMFGLFKDYDYTLVTDDMDCDIGEESILWITETPKTQTGTVTPSIETLLLSENRKNSGIVKKVSKTQNVLLIAIKLSKQ